MINLNEAIKIASIDGVRPDKCDEYDKYFYLIFKSKSNIDDPFSKDIVIKVDKSNGHKSCPDFIEMVYNSDKIIRTYDLTNGGPDNNGPSVLTK